MRMIEILDVGFDFGEGIVPAGRLTLNEENVGVFEHATTASALRVNPFFATDALAIASNPSDFDRVHGVFADSLPDAWGQLLMRRALAESGVDYTALTPIQRLALVGAHGMGALVYRPEIDDAASIPEFPDIDMLSRESLKILEGASSHESLIQLERLGGSSGGTRPKVLVSIDDSGRVRSQPASGYELWIIKFRCINDVIDAGPLEVVYADMARSAGIAMSDVRLIPSTHGPGHFATKRFDRMPGGKRLHLVSAAGMFDQAWHIPATYTQLLSMTFAVTRQHLAVEQMFRRMIFNVLSNNRDDHLRQHAFLMDERGSWMLAPAYDLTYSPGPAGQHYLCVNGKPLAISIDDLRAVGKAHAIKNVDDIAHDVARAVDRFNEYAAGRGVSDATRMLVGTEIRARLTEAKIPGYPETLPSTRS